MSRFALLILDLSSEAAAICNIQFTIKLSLIITKSILIVKSTDSTEKSKRFTSQSSLQAITRYISDTNFFQRTVEFHRGFFVTPEYHQSLSNLDFYTIRSITMFLKVLNKFKSAYKNLNYYLLLT